MTGPTDPLAKLTGITDPAARARLAWEMIDQRQDEIVELSRIRYEAMVELVDGGMTHQEIADRLGVSRARVGQLLKGVSVRERRRQPDNAADSDTVGP